MLWPGVGVGHTPHSCARCVDQTDVTSQDGDSPSTSLPHVLRALPQPFHAWGWRGPRCSGARIARPSGDTSQPSVLGRCHSCPQKRLSSIGQHPIPGRTSPLGGQQWGNLCLMSPSLSSLLFICVYRLSTAGWQAAWWLKTAAARLPSHLLVLWVPSTSAPRPQPTVVGWNLPGASPSTLLAGDCNSEVGNPRDRTQRAISFLRPEHSRI